MNNAECVVLLLVSRNISFAFYALCEPSQQAVLTLVPATVHTAYDQFGQNTILRHDAMNSIIST